MRQLEFDQRSGSVPPSCCHLDLNAFCSVYLQYNRNKGLSSLANLHRHSEAIQSCTSTKNDGATKYHSVGVLCKAVA